MRSPVASGFGLDSETETTPLLHHHYFFFRGATREEPDLLLLRSDALWVQVPVGVQVPSGDAQVFHSDGGAVRQVCIRGGTDVTSHRYKT